MLNTLELNNAELNALAPAHGLVAADVSDLEFEGYSLQPGDGTIVSEDILVDSAPSRETPNFYIPRFDGGAFLGDYFRERRIKVRGIISAATSALLEEALDAFKMRLSVREGNLDRKQPGTGLVRRIRATLVNTDSMFARREGYHITFCPFDLEFLSLEPMWHDPDYTTETSESVEVAPEYGIGFENTGTYKTQPVVVIIVEAATAATAIGFENNTNGDSIEITGVTIQAGDIVVIDSEAKSFTLNGVEQDYDGAFPEIVTGDNNVAVTTDATTLTASITFKYKPAYL